MDFLAAVHLTYMSEYEQVREIKENCWKICGYDDDLSKFVCGVTDYFKPLYRALYNCITLVWLRPLKMAHCIFEAQSQSEREIQSASQYLMQKEQRNFKRHLTFMFITLTAYDVQTIGFVASLNPADLRGLVLMSAMAVVGDVELIIKACLTYSKFFPIRIVLMSNELTKDIEAKLRLFGVPDSQCY